MAVETVKAALFETMRYLLQFRIDDGTIRRRKLRNPLGFSPIRWPKIFRPRSTSIQRKLRTISLSLFIIHFPLIAQGDKTFSLPLDHLRNWAEKAVISIPNAIVKGHSRVHDAVDDCEMHFAARVSDYDGDPAGVVLEPMNVCKQKFFGKPTYSRAHWISFGDLLKGKTVEVAGVPRIWPEHLEGEQTASNPHHALEIHPVTQLTFGAKLYDFSSFIYAPNGFDGIKTETAQSILAQTVVGVVRNQNAIDVDFASGRIGNFCTLRIRIRRPFIESLAGGHRMQGEVLFSNSQNIPVQFLSIGGSQIDSAISRFQGGSMNQKTFDALVLFSLAPNRLLEAATQSHGERVGVNHPLQLILYGVPQVQ